MPEHRVILMRLNWVHVKSLKCCYTSSYIFWILDPLNLFGPSSSSLAFFKTAGDLSLMSWLLSPNVAFLFRQENWSEFILFIQMKGEKELVEKILQTEISIFRSIRDGSALMQHMEDFYYITLLEVQVILIVIFYYGILIIISMFLFNYSIICHCFGCKSNWVSEPFLYFYQNVRSNYQTVASTNSNVLDSQHSSEV